MAITSEQHAIMRAVLTAAASLSLLGSVAVLVLVLVFDRFSAPHIRLVFFLSVATLGKALSNLMGDVRDDPVLCDVQASTSQFFDWAASLYVGTIALTVYSVVSSGTPVRYWMLHLGVWSLAALFAGLPFIGDHYGHAGAWCWITREGNGDVWRFLTFYLPLLLIFIAILITYVKIQQHIAHKDANAGSTSLRERAESKKEVELDIVRRLRLFPLAFLLIWTMPLVNRVHDWISPDNPSFALLIAHVSTAPLQGFAYSLMFCLDQDTRQRLVYWRVYLDRCLHPQAERNRSQARAFVFDASLSEDASEADIDTLE